MPCPPRCQHDSAAWPLKRLAACAHAQSSRPGRLRTRWRVTEPRHDAGVLRGPIGASRRSLSIKESMNRVWSPKTKEVRLRTPPPHDTGATIPREVLRVLRDSAPHRHGAALQPRAAQSRYHPRARRQQRSAGWPVLKNTRVVSQPAGAGGWGRHVACPLRGLPTAVRTAASTDRGDTRRRCNIAD